MGGGNGLMGRGRVGGGMNLEVCFSFCLCFWEEGGIFFLSCFKRGSQILFSLSSRGLGKQGRFSQKRLHRSFLLYFQHPHLFPTSSHSNPSRKIVKRTTLSPFPFHLHPAQVSPPPCPTLLTPSPNQYRKTRPPPPPRSPSNQ